MNAILPSAASGASSVDVTADLRAGAEEICAQLCAVVAGDFGFRVETASEDEAAQKLAMLSNFVLDAARRAVEAARAARLGTWWRDLACGTLTMSNEMHALLGTDPWTFQPTLPNLLALIHPDDREAAAEAFSRTAVCNQAVEHEWRVLRPDGTLAWFWAETRIEPDAAGHAVAVRGVCQDVTERRAGLVPPDVFIPVAETSGAISAIGAWVLREACLEAARWAEPLRVAVNVSPLQAQQGEGFADMVEQALAVSGLAPSRLELEVTEGVLIRDADRVLTALCRLKARGVRVALDDFGTGYSSLAALRAFSFDKMKIDKSFVAGVAAGGQDAAIVRAVLGLARGLRLPVVVEEVETEAQLLALRTEGCEEVQGWLIGHPAPIESFAHLTGAPAIFSAA